MVKVGKATKMPILINDTKEAEHQDDDNSEWSKPETYILSSKNLGRYKQILPSKAKVVE